MSFNLNKIEEKCGVFGVSCSDLDYSITGMLYSGLMALQHRGQFFAGISVNNSKKKIYSYKNKGTVSKVLNQKILRRFSGNIGIGHVGNGNIKNQNIENAQPYHFISEIKRFSISLNGSLTNYQEIKNFLEQKGKIITSKSDIEIICVLIDCLNQKYVNYNVLLKKFIKLVKGAYSFLLLTEDGKMFAVKDPSGIKPFCFGEVKEEEKTFHLFASESSALDAVGASLIREILPGEIIEINPIEGLHFEKISTEKKKTPCLFEYIYFSRPDSIIDGISVFDIRYNLGRKLAKSDSFNAENKIVVPVPDSGRSAAMGYAWQSKIPYQEGLIKNRYVWKKQFDDIREKLNPINSIIKKKDLIIIDHSIISGMTLKRIIEMLRHAGANKIHVRIASPPIINKCQFNNNLSNKEFLIARQAKMERYCNFKNKIRQYINADTLKFISTQDLYKIVGVNANPYCRYCFRESLEKKELDSSSLSSIT